MNIITIPESLSSNRHSNLEVRSDHNANAFDNTSYSAILHNLISVAQNKQNLSEAVLVLATLDGRIDSEDAISCLTKRDSHFIEQFGYCEIFLDSETDNEVNSIYPSLVVSEISKIAIQFPNETIPYFQQVAKIRIDTYDILNFNSATNNTNSIFENIFESRGSEHILDILDKAQYHIDHIDPVVLHVGQQTFTNFDQFNNLLARPAVKRSGFTLTDLRERDFEDWSYDEKMLVSCIYILTRAKCRIEEFNGQQLNLVRVEAHLRSKYEQLCDETGLGVKALGLVELADSIVDLRNRVRSQKFVYRTVNGLTFNKHEHFFDRAGIDLSIGAMPEQMAAAIEARFGLHRHDHASIDNFFGAAAAAALNRNSQARQALTPLEQLFELIVRSAIAETRAHIGMTRGVRDLHRWSALFANHSYVELCDLAPADYYCAVFADQQTEVQLRSADQLSKVFTAIAQRMTFNSWHYTPGHVPIDAVPNDRHFYVPPRMSDLTVWSDSRHQGHILAKVRHCIRSPGGLMVNGKKQHGLFDIRLMRSDGDPFELEDLICARRHTAYLRAVLQAVLDSPQPSANPAIVQSFTKKYYKNA